MELTFKRFIDLLKSKGFIGTARHIYRVLLNRLNKTLPQILLFVLQYFVKSKLRKFEETDVKKVVEFIWKFCYGAFAPDQVKKELVEMLGIYSSLDPKYVLEIGTAKGGTLFALCKLANPNAVIISVDLLGGPFGGGYPKWKTAIYGSFVRDNQKLYLLRMDSHDERTLETIKHILNGNRFDFIFIDGDHSYEGVRKDYEMYANLVREGGIIAIHDIVENGDPILVGGVPMFWSELKNSVCNKSMCFEFIESVSQSGYGIGMIKKGI